MQWEEVIQQGRPDFGDAFSNFQVMYQYPNNVNVSIHTTKVGPSLAMYAAGLSAQKAVLKRITAAEYLLTAKINGIRVLQKVKRNLRLNNRHRVFSILHCMMQMQIKKRHLLKVLKQAII